MNHLGKGRSECIMEISYHCDLMLLFTSMNKSPLDDLGYEFEVKPFHEMVCLSLVLFGYMGTDIKYAKGRTDSRL